MSELKLENYEDFDYDDNFSYDYDQEYDDYEAFKQVNEEVMDDYSEEEVKPVKKSSSQEYYEKLREQINKEVEEIDDKRSFTSVRTSHSSDTSIFGTLFNIVVWACIAVAIVLFIYFIITRQIVTAFLYVIGLIVAFLVGYGLMYFFDNFLISKD